MKIYFKLFLLILVLSLLLPLSLIHAAPPPMGQNFQGNVTLDGVPAPDGTSVTAEMNGRTAGSDNTSGGQYSLTINTIEGDQAGDTITFFVDGYSAGSTTLDPGEITQRNLSASSPLPQHTLTMAVDGQGSTSPSVGNHTYNEGQSVSIRANPANGWLFDHWEGDVANPNSANTSVTIDGDKTVTAVFEEIPTYTLTMAVNGEGSVSPASGSHEYEENDTVNISATPAEGWRFVNWSGDVADRNSDSTTVVMNDNKTVTANFAPRDSFTLTIDIEGEGTTSPAAGTHTYARDQVVEITATPASGYKFNMWTGEVADPSSATTTVTINADKTVVVRFVPLAYYELTLEVNGSGTTEPALGEHSFTEGREVSISAIPAQGHRFTGWTGDVTDPTSATTTVIMNSDKTVVANFEEGPPPPPVLIRIEVVFQTRNEAVIIWEFDKPVAGSMEYRAEGSPGQQAPQEPGFSPMHVTLLENLEPGTVYTYTVTATDEAGNQVTTDENTFATAYNDARFVITGWDSSVAITETGRQISVQVTVANTGDVAGGYELVLKVDGAVTDTRNVTLEPEAEQTVSFSTSIENAGTHTIEVNGFKFSIEIPEPPEEPVTPDPEPEPFDFGQWLKTSWPVILGVVLGIVLIIVISIIILRRYYYIVTFIRR